MPRKEDHEVHKGHVVSLDPKKTLCISYRLQMCKFKTSLEDILRGGAQQTKSGLDIFILEVPK